jgi:sirohydrochlorin ferrochelatase
LSDRPAYLLVFHGSRDSRPRLAVDRLADLVRARLAAREEVIVTGTCSAAVSLLDRPEILLETASLEFAIPLHERIGIFAREAADRGFNRLKIVPLFLLRGVHVRDDIPREVSLARSILPVEIAPHIGEYRELANIAARSFDRHPGAARILLAHGSRLPEGRAAIASLADRLNASFAFWSVAPGLRDTLETLIASGQTSIVVLPYFLFAGAITDEIERQVHDLSQRHTNVNIALEYPLGATEELARAVAKGALLANAEALQ